MCVSVCVCSWLSWWSSTCTATSWCRYLSRLATWPTWKHWVWVRTVFRVCLSLWAASLSCEFSTCDTTSSTKSVSQTLSSSVLYLHLCTCILSTTSINLRDKFSPSPAISPSPSHSDFLSLSLSLSLLFCVCRGVYITDSILVDLGISSSCAIGNNELVITRN